MNRPLYEASWQTLIRERSQRLLREETQRAKRQKRRDAFLNAAVYIGLGLVIGAAFYTFFWLITYAVLGW